MDAGDLDGNLSISDEVDISAELRGLQEHSSNNSSDDLQLHNRSNPTNRYRIQCLYNCIDQLGFVTLIQNYPQKESQ